MNDRHGILDSITGVFVPIHRDGYKFVAGAAVATLFLFLLSATLGWLGVIATASIAYFFRDPDRVTPTRDGLVVSAGRRQDRRRRSVARRRASLPSATETLTRISVFLSIFDVHIVRAPVAGRIVSEPLCAGRIP